VSVEISPLDPERRMPEVRNVWPLVIAVAKKLHVQVRVYGTVYEQSCTALRRRLRNSFHPDFVLFSTCDFERAILKLSFGRIKIGKLPRRWLAWRSSGPHTKNARNRREPIAVDMWGLSFKVLLIHICSAQ